MAAHVLRRAVCPALRGIARAPAPAPARLLSTASYECILHERDGPVALITLNRPKALNAFNSTLVRELMACASEADEDPDVGAIVITGSEKAFAAGADIREMASKSYMDMYLVGLFDALDGLARFKTPVVAAVNGFALGGGCELAMACDTIIAGDTAVFGQPEIKLGIIPGLGGTQRFARAVGKARAMELVLTGDQMKAEEACARGLVSRVVPAANLKAEALATAHKMAANSRPIVALARACVNVAFETPLEQGMRFERQTFFSCFGTEDQKIGMKAFAEKQKPEWKHK